MPLVYEGHEFEAIKLRYEGQVDLLRVLTGIDLRIMTGFITVQLILGGWVSAYPPDGIGIKTGLLIIDLGVALFAGSLLRNQSLRRKEVIATIHNLSEALGYDRPGSYLPNRAINAPTTPRLWFGWYIFGITLSVLGFCAVLFTVVPNTAAVQPTAAVDERPAQQGTAVDRPPALARGSQPSVVSVEPWRVISPVSICSLIVAAVALCVAWDLRRKTTKHVFTVVQSSSGLTESSAPPVTFHHFEVYLKNLGLPFPQMAVDLGFRKKNGKAWVFCPLRAIDIRTGKASDAAPDVATGLVVRFGWRSHEMDDSEICCLMSLEDLREQHAVLSVYCADYMVARINLASWRERLKQRWKDRILMVFHRFRLGSYAENQDSWRARIRSPDSQLLPFSLTHFLCALREERNSNKAIQATSEPAPNAGPDGAAGQH